MAPTPAFARHTTGPSASAASRGSTTRGSHRRLTPSTVPRYRGGMSLRTSPVALARASVLALSSTLALAACGGDATTSGAGSGGASSADGASAATTSDAAATRGAPAGPALHLEEVVVRDPARRNMPAYRFLVPEGWELEGGVQPVGPAYHMVPFFSDVTVTAPDGRGARFWGMLEFGYADGVPAPRFAPMDGRSFFPIPESLGDYWLEAFELSPAEGVTDLEVVSERVLPDATKHVREMMAALYESTRQENRQLSMTGESKEFDVDARELVIRYDHDGVATQATVFAMFRKAIYRYPGGAIRAAMWNLDHMYAVFAPVGVDATTDPAIAAVVRSRREDPAWQRAIQEWYLEKNRRIVAEGNAKIAAAARAAATARTTQSQDILDISFQGWKSRNAANDAGHAASVNAIHERTTFAEPGGTTVDLPSHYRNVYTDGQGHYVLHDDANWDIGADPAWNQRDWQRIEPVD